jgi:hypothetical protein
MGDFAAGVLGAFGALWLSLRRGLRALRCGRVAFGFCPKLTSVSASEVGPPVWPQQPDFLDFVGVSFAFRVEHMYD